jgi:ESCRT-I complex subunit TSG101
MFWVALICICSVNNSGVQMRLLSLSGTIPIKYQGVVYNIPVEIFLPERYPLEAPKVFVRPTASKSLRCG